MEKKTPWHEQDRFWDTVSDFMFTRQKLSTASEEVELILSILEVEPGARILDQC